MTEPMTSGEPEQPERPIGNGVSNGRCSKGWPAFWLVVVCGTASTVINALVLPAFSTAFFNGGTNPCIDEGHASAACKEALKKAERIGSNFTVLGAVCVFFTSPNIALLCDRFGRKPIMILGQVAGFLSVLSLVAVDIFGISLYFYYVLSVVASAACLQVVFALWIADRTTTEQRIAFFATLAAAMDVEQTVTPVASFVPSTRNRLILSACLSFLALAATVLGIPESISENQRRDICRNWRLSRLFQFGIVASKKYRGLTLLMLVSNSVHAGCGAIYLYYIQGHFGKGLRDVAPIIMLNGINNLLVQIFVVKHLARCLTVRGVILLGYFFGALNCAIISFVPNFNDLYVLAVTSGLGVIFAPAIQALYMNSAQPDEMGQVQGAVNSVLTVTGGLGPLIFSRLLAAFQDSRMDCMPYLLTIASNFFCSWAVAFMALPQKADDSLTVQLECAA